MNTWIIIALIIACLLLVPMLRRNNRRGGNSGTYKRPKKATIGELPGLLDHLRNGEMSEPSFGILGPESCLFFEYIDGKFVIDYQAIFEDELPNIEVLRRYAADHGLQAIDTTYKVKPEDYDHLQYAPVLRIVVSPDTAVVERVARDIESSIFNHDENTVYSLVP